MKKMMGEEWIEHWHHRKPSFFGTLLLVVGMLWLAKEMGWIPNIPIWPVIMIMFGLWLILRRSWI